jgi:hypothetical protein
MRILKIDIGIVVFLLGGGSCLLTCCFLFRDSNSNSYSLTLSLSLISTLLDMPGPIGPGHFGGEGLLQVCATT